MELHVVNKSETDVEITIEGIIGWDDEASWRSLKKKLTEIANSKAKKIVVNINSLGGYVSDGLMIHDALKMAKAKIETRTFAMTASAATIVAQAGDKRKMSSNGLYLIHRASNVAFGNVNEMKAAVDELEKVDERIFALYIKRGGNEDKIKELMDENNGQGKWIDAEEALEVGLIDEIIEPSRAAALVDASVLTKYNLPPITEEMKKTFFERAADLLKGRQDEQEEAISEVTDEVEGTVEETVEETVEAVAEVTELPVAITEEPVEVAEAVVEDTVAPVDVAELTAKITDLEALIAARDEKIEAMGKELADAKSLLVQKVAASTKVKGRVGGEDDDIEKVHIPFEDEIKAFDSNLMYGTPLETPKSK